LDKLGPGQLQHRETGRLGALEMAYAYEAIRQASNPASLQPDALTTLIETCIWVLSERVTKP